MNNEQGNQTIQDGNYKATFEDGKLTIYTGKQSPEDQQLASKLMDKIGKKVNDLALLVLLKEGNISYKDMELNKKTDKAVNDFVTYIRRLKSERYDRRYIERQARARANEIEKDYHKNAAFEAQKWTDWQNKVIARFKEDKLIANTHFEEPQAEILKRQNFNAKLDAMTEDEFKGYINDLSTDDQLSDYELNTLLAKAGNNDSLRDKLKVYEYQTRKSYEVLPEWQNVIKLISFAKMWTRSNVFYYDSEGNGIIFYPETIILRELKDYTVSDPSQW